MIPADLYFLERSAAPPRFSDKREKQDEYWSVLRLIGSVSCGIEKVEAFFFSEEVADVTNGIPERIVSAGGGLSDQGLEL